MVVGCILGYLCETSMMIAQLFGWLETSDVAQDAHLEATERRQIIS